VRAARGPINERGTIYRSDLVVVADDTLLAVPAAGTLQGIDAHTVVLVNSRESAATWRHRLNLDARLLILPATPEAGDRAELPCIGAACAGAAACLLGIIERAALAQAIAEELAALGPDIVSGNQARALEAYDAVADQRGTVEEGLAVGADHYQAPEWVERPSTTPGSRRRISALRKTVSRYAPDCGAPCDPSSTTSTASIAGGCAVPSAPTAQSPLTMASHESTTITVRAAWFAWVSARLMP
jgi:Pyruvate/2-oxoacid:ferredoxin oxidoreductase gamma subunit